MVRIFLPQLSTFLFNFRYSIWYTLLKMKSKSENKLNWISGKEAKSRALVYKLIDINKEIDSTGKTFRLGDKVYFVRELG